VVDGNKARQLNLSYGKPVRSILLFENKKDADLTGLTQQDQFTKLNDPL
jgi:hypothetical protein